MNYTRLYSLDKVPSNAMLDVNALCSFFDNFVMLAVPSCCVPTFLPHADASDNDNKTTWLAGATQLNSTRAVSFSFSSPSFAARHADCG